MKLVFQIAGGILLAAVLTWVMWLGIFAAAVPIVVKQLPAVPRAISVGLPPGIRVWPVAVVPVPCRNFVQMASGERRCLGSVAAQGSVFLDRK
jgi:hypothetical protein